MRLNCFDLGWLVLSFFDSSWLVFNCVDSSCVDLGCNDTFTIDMKTIRFDLRPKQLIDGNINAVFITTILAAKAIVPTMNIVLRRGV